jgi:hypothetical protein
VIEPARLRASTGGLRRRLETEGYVVLRQAVAPPAVDAALRRLNLEIRRGGLSAEEIARCQLGTFFPHLRWEPEVWGALPPQAAELLGWQQGDDWAEPQLLLKFPDDEQPWPLQPHVDELPPWAGRARVYRGIVGVALTAATARDGAPVVWPGSHRSPVIGAEGSTAEAPTAQVGTTSGSTAVALAPGDALVMHPQLGHSGSLNLGSTIRSAIYFRLLTDAP